MAPPPMEQQMPPPEMMPPPEQMPPMEPQQWNALNLLV
jgi:hypothetical protein